VIPLGKPDLRRALEAVGCEILETDRTARGMGASLAAGVEASARHEGWIVALGDMPRVEVATIAAVRSALESGALIAAPFHEGRRGHPVGFAAALRDELLALDGDVGARAALERHAAEVRRLDVADEGILVDIDTAADLDRIEKGDRSKN
jgi:molybdenum cofactor cytidylyltransferase